MKLCCHCFGTVDELCGFVNLFKIKRENIQCITDSGNNTFLYYWQPCDAPDLDKTYADYLMEHTLKYYSVTE